MTNYPHAGIQHSETWRESPRLTSDHTPGEVRFHKYTAEILAESENAEREAEDAIFYLWRFIRNLREIRT